ncbi:MAG: adenine deaminase [Candidatus Gastranaerophilaceae bacterium]
MDIFDIQNFNKEEKIIKTAKGDIQADLVLKNAKIVNVLSEEIYEGDVAISDGVIAGVGNDYHGVEEIDVQGAYVSPSFIDGHVHLESSMLMPSEFAKMVVPSGTTTVVADPHEISNVMGLQGISFMREATKNLPLDVYMTLPSCVPATSLETSGVDLNSYDLALLIDAPWVLGIAEMMNFPGVINCDSSVLSKVRLGLEKHKRVDGHAPHLSGKALNAYVAAGIRSDHECTTVEEAVEKLRLGMYLMVREATGARDLESLLPVLKNLNTRKCIFVTDDRHPKHLEKHISRMVKKAVKNGVDPIKAIQMASLNTAEYFNLSDLGAIAPGYRADIAVFKDLENFEPLMVFKNGKLAAKDGKMVIDTDNLKPPALRGSVNIKYLYREDLQIKTPQGKTTAKVINVIPKQLITKQTLETIKTQNDLAVSDVENDILKIAVIERHKATGNIGLGFVKGFGLKSGAIASTVAHDSHNMIVIGTNDEDMYHAAVELVKSQGGKIIVQNGKTLAHLKLPVAGLMSDKTALEVQKDIEALDKAAKQIGCKIDEPFMSMAFLSLSVIPEIKITDKGLIDVNSFEVTDLFV